jgi:hypothetical protein
MVAQIEKKIKAEEVKVVDEKAFNILLQNVKQKRWNVYAFRAKRTYEYH